MKLLLIALAPLFAIAPLFACGCDIYEGVLASPGMLLGTPETCFAAEIKRIGAAEFRFPKKDEATVFIAHLDAALTRSGINAEARQKLVEAYRVRRIAISENPQKEKLPPIPAGLPEAFVLFEKAGDVWRGSDGAQEPTAPDARYTRCKTARDLWRAVLAKPEAERRELTVPALYMLARAELENDAKDTTAKTAIEAVRAAVRAGAPDPAGYAAATYQLERHRASGDIEEVAILLKLAAADAPGPRLLELKRALRKTLNNEWYDKKSRSDALLAHPEVRAAMAAYLASQPAENFGDSVDLSVSVKRTLAWINAVLDLPGKLPEAGTLSAVAYGRGDIPLAQLLVARADDTDPLAALIASRILLRADHPDLATDRLAKSVPPTGVLWDKTGRTYDDDLVPNLVYDSLPFQFESRDAIEAPIIPPASLAHDAYHQGETNHPISLNTTGATQAMVALELGVLRLKQGNSVEALTLFLRTAHWRDAAVVAERYMTTEELLHFCADAPDWLLPVKPTPPGYTPEGETPRPGNSPRAYLRHVIGMRLMRENRFAEAGPYLPESMRPVLRDYIADCQIAYDTKRPVNDRVIAFTHAAKLLDERGTGLFMSVSGPRSRNHRWSDSDAARNADIAPSDKLTSPLPEQRDRVMRFRSGELRLLAASLLPNNDETSATLLDAAAEAHEKQNDPDSARLFRKLLHTRHPDTKVARDHLELLAIVRAKTAADIGDTNSTMKQIVRRDEAPRTVPAKPTPEPASVR
jgi:hypothetical protein